MELSLFSFHSTNSPLAKINPGLKLLFLFIAIISLFYIDLIPTIILFFLLILISIPLGFSLKSQFQDFYYDLNLLNSANGITYLYQNIYSDDEKYIRDYQASSNYYVVCNDLYNQLLKTIYNSKYFKNFRTDLGLTSKDIEYIKNYQIYLLMILGIHIYNRDY